MSQLLLVSIATGADILEFVSETIEEHNADTCSPVLRFTIWAVWVWSLLQFGLVLTASTNNDQSICGNGCFSKADVWGVTVTLVLQDIPFFAARVFFLFKLNIHSQMMWFFGSKNLLVLILQIYRLWVLKHRVLAVSLLVGCICVTLGATFFDKLI